VSALVAANPGALRYSDVVVLGTSEEDFLMAVNSRSILLACGWCPDLDAKTRRYGVLVDAPQRLEQVIGFLEDKHPWYFQHHSAFLDVFSLTDAGTKYESDAQLKRLAERLQSCLKNGQPIYKNAFRLHLLSSLYSTGGFKSADVWSYYPSSDSKNSGQEIMTEFSELARTTFGKRNKGPLVIRHKPSVKRHMSGGDRNDPRSQLDTIHLNPEYRDKLAGKTVVIMDDYLTRGVSFGVSASLLQKAGAAKMIGVSMGKFGNASNVYSIEIQGDPFAPLKKYQLISMNSMTGAYEADAKLQFLKKFRHSL
jgi:predicted amidophosphoribosyltransferase